MMGQELMMKTLALLLFATTLSLTLPCAADDDVIAALSVSGHARLMVPPDQVSIDLGVSTSADSAQKAMNANNAAMDKVLAAVKKMGLESASIKTRQFQLQPVWSPRPREATADWQAEITSYRVSNSVLLSTSQINLAGEIIGRAAGAGANRVNSISFGLSDPRAHREAAIAQATANAESDARSLAAAAGQTIVRILSLNLDHSDASPIALRSQNVMRSAMAQDSSAPPLEAGDVTVRASVSIRYQIK
jgi:uncharacterized protein YggE